MQQLGNGLSDADHHADALVVKEAELSVLRRLGGLEQEKLAVQTNLAITYSKLGRLEEALRTERDVYSGKLRFYGEDHESTLIAANNYAWGLYQLERFGEAKALMRKTTPVARRALGSSNVITLRMRWVYAKALYLDPAATLDDVGEAVTTLEDTAVTARRVLGGAHPTTGGIDESLEDARDILRMREGSS